jgi:large subunit ribosomal protein L24
MKATKPRTQRRRIYNAAAHATHRYFSAPLTLDLKEKYNTNAIPVKTGDTVRVMRGDRKGFEGRIIRTDRKKHRIYVEGVTREKVDGTSIPIPIHPSKVMIVNLNLDDKWRREALNRKIPQVETPRTEPGEEDITVLTEAKKVKKPEKKTRKRKTAKRTTRTKKTRTRKKTTEKTESKGAK